MHTPNLLSPPPDTTPRTARTALALAALAAPLFLAGCGSHDTGSSSSAPPVPTANEHEVRTSQPRALVAHEGGLTLLDTTTGDVLDTVARDGFLRLSPAGDGRHVMISDGDGFGVYDTGIHSTSHGDHSHHHAGPGRLTRTRWTAAEPGHVVAHNGFTTLFDDGTGTITSVDSADIADPEALVRRHTTRAPHHGVAMVLEDGSLLTTHGTARQRSTVEVIDGRSLVARTGDCPGVHGEATAQPTPSGTDVVVLGCENGPVVWRGGAFHKVRAAGYQRNGNLVGHPDSPVVLGDHKTDAAAARAGSVEHPTAVALIDTRTHTLRTVELGSSYWFRSLGRGPGGEALVLTQDGSLRVIDPETGTQTSTIAAIGAWTEPADWQAPGPALVVAGRHAYVSDPATDTLVVIDVPRARVLARHPIPAGATELAVTTGSVRPHTH